MKYIVIITLFCLFMILCLCRADCYEYQTRNDNSGFLNVQDVGSSRSYLLGRSHTKLAPT